MRSDIKELPSLDELNRLFIYEPGTGRLLWRVRPHVNAKRSAPGTEAGTIRRGRCAYRIIGLGDGNYCLAHRVVWKMVTGKDPVEFIDHINGDKLDNRFANLREATNGQNRSNAKLNSNNSTGVKGVHIRTKGNYKKYRAVISKDKIYHRLGDFDTLHEAAMAVEAKRVELHGIFARQL